MFKFLIFLFLISSFLFGNFADTYGISSKEVSRGNAVVADVNNFSSVYYNIAGLGRGSATKNKNESALSYMYTIPNLYLNISKETNALKDLNFGTITLGMVLDLRNFINLPDIISTAKFGMLAGLMQDGTLVKINDLDIRAHTFIRYGREIERAVIFSGIGLGFKNDMFGIGVGANIWTKGEGKIEMRNLELNSETQIPSAQTKLDLAPKIAPVFGGYFSYGNFNLGFSYKHEIYMELPLDTNAEMMLAGVEMALELNVLDFYSPTSLIVGISYEFSNFLLSFDLEYQAWSGFKFSEIAKNFVENYNKDNADKEDISLPKMNDILIPKLGVSYKGIENWELSFGYYYRPTFLPEDSSNTLVNLMDSNANIISAGVNYKIPDNSVLVAKTELNLTTQLQILSSKDVIKSPEFESDLNPSYNFNGTVISLFAEVLMRW